MAESAVLFLLRQLSVLLLEEKQLLGGLEREVKYIHDEMQQMSTFLRVADEKEESDPNLKVWIRQLREISYDVEDVLDNYMLQFSPHRGTNGCCGCITEVYASIQNLIARHQIASKIQALKYELEVVCRRQQKYKKMYGAIMEQGSSSRLPEEETYDGRSDALLLEEDDVVGIEKPRKQLLEWIWSTGVGLKVISVFGMPGLGKTTLVKKVYDDKSVERHFDSHVLIVVSDYTKPEHLLECLIKKLVEEIKKPPPQGLGGMKIAAMQGFIYEFLKKKKYIIVLDDVWKLSTWEAIKCAFPKRDAQCCIIITTRFTNIANAACSETGHVYELKPLPVEESKMLFYKKALARCSSNPDHLRESAENILKRCEGLPLAIVVIAGLLATKNYREWAEFNRSIADELDKDGKLNRLWKLLSLSYNDLPYYLKYCFLYLSIFPEEGLREKEKIIRLWIAEGFVQSKHNRSMEEEAEDYLNELIGRNLIRVERRHRDGRTREFRIHDLVREYIASKSREQNIVTTYDGGQMQWPNKIRRLAIQKSVSFSQLETNNFEYLRSLLCDGNLMVSDAIKELLKRCRILKVLHLRGAPLETIPDEVFKLYHLKYLCLRNTRIKFIPKSIKYLENLETLDLKNSDVTELPNEILKLHKLRHLIVYKYKGGSEFSPVQSFKAPYDIGNCLPCLQKLCYIDADEVDGVKTVIEIGKLTQLRRLEIAKLRSEDGKDLCSSIAKLTNLRSLAMVAVEESEKLDLDYPLSSIGLPSLRILSVHGCLEKVPQWVPSLHGLTTLMLHWSGLRDDPLNYLQDLPNLLRLVIHGAYVEGLSFKARGFQKLETLVLGNLNCLKWVTVEKGSMPCLQEWYFRHCELLTDLPQGIEHLTDLSFLALAYMAEEFFNRVANEQISQGDNWRLAHVSQIWFLPTHFPFITNTCLSMTTIRLISSLIT